MSMPMMKASSPKNLDQQRCTRMQDTCDPQEGFIYTV